LFFTTFKPVDPADATQGKCNTGSSKLWGMDYIQKETTVASGGGKPVPPFNPQLLPVTSFGTRIIQKTTCTTAAVASTTPYLGYGVHTSYSSISPGGFQLVVQTGSGGTPVSGTQTNTATYDLPSPPNSSHIDSWGALLDFQ